MKIVQAIAKALVAYQQRHCKHIWRGARTSLGPAKYCDKCGSIVQINSADYYAQFGHMPHKWY
jgi:hypothetical protein